MRTGIAELPLHSGKAPAWLFQRMVKLAREITIAIVDQFGPGEMVFKLSDPFWFQAFGCLLGFDWHSSGVTTTVCGALKEGLKELGPELGLFVVGGKGRVSRQTPAEIEVICQGTGQEAAKLVYASRMAAKVDSAALQDSYQIYHHSFIFTREGQWGVVQQGMNPEIGYARRYHWVSESLADFVCEPHAAICCDRTGTTLNMVAGESAGTRAASAAISAERPELVLAEVKKVKSLILPSRHQVSFQDLDEKRLATVLLKTYEKQPADFEALLGTPGVGPKAIRALSLLSELLYGVETSLKDPARFSFAHGGKDRHPYPVDRESYDRTIQVLGDCVRAARLGAGEKMEALKRLNRFG